jgi:glucose-1-phosphate thymidylyltransferase
MKGIVLAGGLGTRLYPLTLATSKHLLPVYDQCMVWYPIQTLLRAGVDSVMLVTGGPHAGHYLRVFGDGKKLGIKHLEYTYQETEGGIAQALSLCEDFCDGEPLLVALGDNITNADLSRDVAEFTGGAKIFLKEVPDPERFGCPVFDAADSGRLARIEEKPTQPGSSYAVTGFYIYDGQVFDFIRTLKPSGRGELEITDVNNCYLGQGQLAWAELGGYWLDAGTSFDSLFRANKTIAEERQRAGS